MCFHLFHSHEVSNNLYSSTVSTCNKYPLYKRTLKWLGGRYQRLVLKIVIWLILYCFRASGYITCPLNANSQPKYHFITRLRVKNKLCPTLSPRATSGTDTHVFPLSIVSFISAAACVRQVHLNIHFLFQCHFWPWIGSFFRPIETLTRCIWNWCHYSDASAYRAYWLKGCPVILVAIDANHPHLNLKITSFFRGLVKDSLQLNIRLMWL